MQHRRAPPGPPTPPRSRPQQPHRRCQVAGAGGGTSPVSDSKPWNPPLFPSSTIPNSVHDEHPFHRRSLQRASRPTRAAPHDLCPCHNTKRMTPQSVVAWRHVAPPRGRPAGATPRRDRDSGRNPPPPPTVHSPPQLAVRGARPPHAHAARTGGRRRRARGRPPPPRGTHAPRAPPTGRAGGGGGCVRLARAAHTGGPAAARHGRRPPGGARPADGGRLACARPWRPLATAGTAVGGGAAVDPPRMPATLASSSRTAR